MYKILPQMGKRYFLERSILQIILTRVSWHEMGGGGVFCLQQTARTLKHKIISNKKVLLRERKRHTDRGVSSTTRWGTPSPRQGTPPARSDWEGYPRWGTPCRGTAQPGLMGGTQGGVPPSGYPQPGPTGVPKVGYPIKVPLATGPMGGT